MQDLNEKTNTILSNYLRKRTKKSSDSGDSHLADELKDPEAVAQVERIVLEGQTTYLTTTQPKNLKPSLDDEPVSPRRQKRKD